MFSHLLGNYQDIPINSQKRRCTDTFCCIFTSLFALTIFVFAVIAYIQAPNKSSAYFNLTNGVNTAGPGNITSHDYYGFILTLVCATICCLGLGLLWISIVQLVPLYAPHIAAIMAFICLLVIAVFTFLVQNTIFNNYPWFRYVLAGVIIFTAIVVIVYLVMYSSELKFQGLLLKFSVGFLGERPINFLYILLFLSLNVGLLALFVFQHIAFSFKNHNNNNFFDFANSGFFGIMNIIEFIWGLRFLKDAFIFVIGGNVTDWYWRGKNGLEPCMGISNLMLKNWGSVAVGSFFNSVFRIPLLVIELLICHPTACCHTCGNCCYDNCCQAIIDMVRTDSYAYTNLFGVGYCQAGRQCRHLCLEHTQFQGSQSPMRNYRILASIFLSSLGFILGYAIINVRVVNINIWFVIELLIVVTVITGYFVGINANAAEGLQVSFMVQNQFVGGYNKMKHCEGSVRQGMEELTQRSKRDGSF